MNEKQFTLGLTQLWLGIYFITERIELFMVGIIWFIIYFIVSLQEKQEVKDEN